MCLLHFLELVVQFAKTQNRLKHFKANTKQQDHLNLLISGILMWLMPDNYLINTMTSMQSLDHRDDQFSDLARKSVTQRIRTELSQFNYPHIYPEETKLMGFSYSEQSHMRNLAMFHDAYLRLSKKILTIRP
eukprot:403365392